MMTLLLQLQVRGHARGKESAKQLQVSKRTVQRDVGPWCPPGYRCARLEGRRADIAWTAATARG
jgi:hypothetical protein